MYRILAGYLAIALAAFASGVARAEDSQVIQLQLTWLEIDRGSLKEHTQHATPLSLFGSTQPKNVRTHDGKVTQVAVTEGNPRSQIEELRSKGLVKILAEPTLVTTNGRPTTFHSGGEIPILVTKAETTTTEYREIGTTVRLLPTLREQGLWQIDIRLEISQLDGRDENGTPVLKVRRIDAGLEVREGESIVLIQDSDSGTDDVRSATDTILILTPEVIGPSDISDAPRPLPAE